MEKERGKERGSRKEEDRERRGREWRGRGGL